MGRPTNTFHTEDYTVPNTNLTYRVYCWFDDHMGRPEEEHDAHGPVVWCEYNPHDAEELEDLGCTDEQIMRYALYRPLFTSHRRSTPCAFYDYLGALHRAVKDWGCTEENAPAAVDADYEYLAGWYANDWHWMGITVTKVDEHGDTTGESYSCGGYESLLLYNPSCTRDDFYGVVEELIHECEALNRSAAHRGQMELPLAA